MNLFSMHKDCPHCGHPILIVYPRPADDDDGEVICPLCDHLFFMEPPFVPYPTDEQIEQFNRDEYGETP